MVDFAEWMYANGQAAADAEDVLLSALDILLDMDSAATSSESESLGVGVGVSVGGFGSPRGSLVSGEPSGSMSGRSAPPSPSRSMMSRGNTAASTKMGSASRGMTSATMKPKAGAYTRLLLSST